MKNKSNTINGLTKDESMKELAIQYLQKAKKNISFIDITSRISNESEVKKFLNLKEDFSVDDWVVIIGYYGMYSAALALLAKLGYKSKTHTATILALEEFYVKKNLLTPEDVALMKHISLTNEEIKELAEAKENRETAQYEVTSTITKNLADSIKKIAKNFVAKVEVLLQ